jgi:hypothetical protein
MRYPIAIMAAALLICGTATAFAEADSCTDWLKQTDGTFFRTCTRASDASQYCQRQNTDGTISKVSCK